MKKTQWLIVPILFVAIGACRGQEKNTHTTPQPLPVMPWSEAKKSYITDPNGSKFRIIEANNNQATRQVGIEFLDTTGKVTKSFDLRTAPFAPVFLKAKERSDDMTMREEFIWIEAKNMTLSQKKAALHPKLAGKQKAIEGLRFSVTHTKIRTDMEGENNLSGCIIIEYITENYLKDDVLDINTRIVILDEQGNTVDMIDHIPYGVNELVMTDDLRFVCYNFADMAAVDDYESLTPTGLRLYDRETKKNVIDRKFGETGMGQFPEHPHKIGNKIVLSCSGESLGLEGINVQWIINEKMKCIFRKDIKKVIGDPVKKLYYQSYILNADDNKIRYVYQNKDKNEEVEFFYDKDFQKMTFEEFNNLKFTKSDE